MDSRLVAIAGPLKGSVFALNGLTTTIGRDEGNFVTLADPAVSPKHCAIVARSGQFSVVPINGDGLTFINGLPATNGALEHGDQIQVGSSMFLFLRGDHSAAAASSKPESTVEGGSAIRVGMQLRREDALLLRPVDAQSAPHPEARRTARDFDALLKITTAFSSIRGLVALDRPLLEFIFDVIPADRGAVILLADNLKTWESAFGWDRRTRSLWPVRLDRILLDRVVRGSVAILGSSRSVDADAGSGTGSVLAAPMVVFDRVLGAIFLETLQAAVRFDEGHLQMLTVIAGIAATALDNARHVERLERENQSLQAEMNIEHNMVGSGPKMRAIYQLISRVAPSDSTVLIHGESGTGKELVARAIHRNSPRSAGPFVAINCAALAETLLENELFGHERGAFTGAFAQNKGKFEAAARGTVFLDEVGELSPALQAKLLRVLQEREFERVGGTRPIRVDIRLIAATNRDLDAAIAEGTFRRDLYYRLNVVSLTMPALRDRREDIPLLARYFADKHGHTSKRRVVGISKEAEAYLLQYDWPGNVRELENAMERAIVLGSTDLILPEDLTEAVLETAHPAGAPATGYHDAVTETKKALILRAIDQAHGSYTGAARLLGLHPNYLHRLIRNLGLRPELNK